MRCIIACNRQLPIRYYPLHQLYFTRGIHCPKEISLPFFVNVELDGSNYSLLLEYLKEINGQYIQCDFQVYSDDSYIISFLQQHIPKVHVQGKVLMIEF
ncbi:hypothetical protein AEA09_07625 [Lysinibacillus contaminans]|uniref:Uncharacterized protein n=1 Tax=Lysinibacillus contaminans TaxID=1293441 RepID=A0ABR5K0N0_9BACI|nr:hypothetical protein [Lysinibacillus contaminans]KOS68436.1 hypothetical protein AEA09_07625 [Lysinibacillus contaminans]